MLNSTYNSSALKTTLYPGLPPQPCQVCQEAFMGKSLDSGIQKSAAVPTALLYTRPVGLFLPP